MTERSTKYIRVLRNIITNKTREGGAAMAIRSLLGRVIKWSLVTVISIGLVVSLGTWLSKRYEASDDDPDRGAIAIADGAFGENYALPTYLQQGWKPSDSLWFYNTTQGSGLLPYDFFLVLEEENGEELLRSNRNMDRFRYLPQHESRFNPDALPVGFARDEYKGKDYVGYTCAGCHTGQVNFGGQALRIDGAPAMANMVEFLHALDKSMSQTLTDVEKRKRFVSDVINLDNNYKTEDEVIDDLKRWTGSIQLYNTVNHTNRKYGYARLDAFGRIYNRALQHVINKAQVAQSLSSVVVGPEKRRLVSDGEIENVLQGMDNVILGDKEFSIVLERLQSNAPGYPGLGLKDMLRIRNQIFNEPDAPVSYPFLWDIAHSDYVQWNGLANNAGVGPLGRNTGEVIGVFGILDWAEAKPGFSLRNWIAAKLSGQSRKAKKIEFESSIDKYNLQRLESKLKYLQSPLWSDAKDRLTSQGVDTAAWKIDTKKRGRGRIIYEQYCESCHEIIVRDNWDRLMVARMSSLQNVGTDPKMASNSVNYSGQSGNFEDTIQDPGVGPVVIQETAPVVQILTSATTGVVATPDADKGRIRSFIDWVYILVTTFSDNQIEKSLKAGNYDPDTTASPYASLLSYKARSLNGIWATAPYLHNGSVPSLYDLLLPVRREGDPDTGEYRPDMFMVGSREFDPVRVGFRQSGYEGFKFITRNLGNQNIGHEYAAGKTAQPNGAILPALSEEQRYELLEFLKTL